MTCGLSEGITIEFPRSGVEVRPEDVDIRAKARHLANGEFRFTDEAGIVIAENTTNLEPAVVKFDGYPARRMWLGEDQLEHTQNLDGNDRWDLTLLDPRRVLQRGSYSKTWDNVRLGEAVEHVFNHRDDPENVLTGFRFVEVEDIDRFREEALDTLVAPESFSFGENNVATFFNGLRNFFGQDTDMSASYTGFEWDGVTPLQAIKDIVTEFSINWWIDTTGTIVLGPDGTYGRVLGTVYGDNRLALESYNVTSSADRTDTVQMRGTSFSTQNTTTLDNVSLPDVPGEVEALQLYAESTTDAIDGSSMVLEATDHVTLDELETASRRALFQEIINDTTGSIEINGMASTDIEKLAQLDVGDLIGIDESIETRCNQGVVTGLFLVEEVQHRANSRTGWDITVELTKTVAPNDISTNSFYYDPVTDVTYEDIEALNDAVEDMRNE